MASAVDYLVLTVIHRTNEDWSLVLPLAFSSDDLAGATAACRLKSTTGAEINIDCDVQNSSIIQRAESDVFKSLSGPFSGDVRLTLSGGRDVVTHLINLDLKRGSA